MSLRRTFSALFVFAVLLVVEAIPVAQAAKPLGPWQEQVAAYLRRPKRLIRTPRHAAKFVDLTKLGPEVSHDDVHMLVDRATLDKVATVCVNGVMVPTAARRLANTPNHNVRVTAVVNFPFGLDSKEAMTRAVRQAIDDGASEVDTVIYRGHLAGMSPDFPVVREYVATFAETVRKHAPGGKSKIIIEAAALSDAHVSRISADAAETGVHFVKTSTGFHSKGGATPHHVHLISEAVGDRAGVKAAGGIKTVWDFLGLYVARGGDDVVKDSPDQFRAGASFLFYYPNSLANYDIDRPLEEQHYLQFLRDRPEDEATTY